MRISDWSSDVCSSDLHPFPRTPGACRAARGYARLTMSRLTILAAGAGLTLLPSPPTLGAPASPTAGPAPRVHKVVIDKMKFGPVPAGIRAGDTILWINRDMFRHTAPARDKSFNLALPAGQSGKTGVKIGRASCRERVCQYV